MDQIICKSKKKCKNMFMPDVIERRKINLSSPSCLESILTRKEFVLRDILPVNHHGILSHIFIGFTQDGKHFLSYTSKDDEDDDVKETLLHIWLFRLNLPMQLLSSHIVFTPTDMFSNTSFNAEFDRLPDGVYCYQWSSNNHYLLTVIAPEYPSSRLIHVSVIRIDKHGSYLLSPGTLTFSYNGFGIIDTYMNDFKEQMRTKSTTQDGSLSQSSADLDVIRDAIYSPTIVMGHKRVCAFSTVSEIVFLEIREKVGQEGMTDASIISEVFDVESEIFDKGFAKLNCLELTYLIDAYELLVYDIEESDPVKVHFLVDVCFKQGAKQFFHAYLVVWQPKSREWDVTISGNHDGDLDCRSHYYTVLTHLVRTHNQSYSHSINNLSLTENHTSLSRLDSPVDPISVTLKAPLLSPSKSQFDSTLI